MNRAAELFEIGYEMLSEEENLAIEEEERKSSENFSKSSVALSASNLGGTVIEYPTRFDYHGISTAWSRGLNGRNIGIAIIDSGVLEDDKTFGKNYGQNINGINPSHLNKTYAQNSFYKWCTLCWWRGYDGVYAKGFGPIERGTKSLKIAAGPMGSRARTGELTGISYASNVTSVRGSYGYEINIFSSLLAVTKSFEHLSEQGNVDIISTSLSRTLASGLLARAIKKCTSRGKLVFAAVGAIPDSYYGSNPVFHLFFSMNRTATLFPARMSETIACAGVLKDTQDYMCESCHGQADFVTEFGPTDVNQSSSYSTATTAGIAGLIWGQNPNKSADQVVQEMIDISDNGNHRKGWRGHGRLHLKRYNLRNQL
jgi:subtilisin family serine protease